MAYMRSIERECHCGKRATVEVLNSRNGSVGEYCNACGKRKLKETQAAEADLRAKSVDAEQFSGQGLR